MRLHHSTLISIVFPAFNEGDSLPAVVAGVSQAVAQTNFSFEIIIVDDGSTDRTREVALALCERHSNLRYLRLSRNFGKEASLSAGLKEASGSAVILMDADGQHPASLLPLFINRWSEGFEVVAGVQRSREETTMKRILKRCYYRLLEAGSSVVIPPGAGDFRLLDRKVVDAINALPERNRLMKGLYAWVGFRTDLIPFDAEPRLAGRTKFSWARLFGLGFTGLTSFTVVPLRLVSAAGLFISVSSLLYGLYLLFEHVVQGNNLPGWATLSVGMMFLSGVQLLALGVIGEYLGRTFEEAKQRPVYIIAEDHHSIAAPSPSTVYNPAAILTGERKPGNVPST
jgi:glycosyltransferase involved in cell wall biosynthesis